MGRLVDGIGERALGGRARAGQGRAATPAGCVIARAAYCLPKRAPAPRNSQRCLVSRLEAEEEGVALNRHSQKGKLLVVWEGHLPGCWVLG
jgi:hypothetical protein